VSAGKAGRTRWWLAGALLLSVGPAPGMQQGLFAAPEMEGFVKIQELDGDGNDDGVKETRIRRFRNVNGDRMFTMTAKDQLWAWSVDAVDDDDSQINRNYVLRDSDCDGRFDERYRLDEGFNLPACLE
jgi:hypothetical protein